MTAIELRIKYKSETGLAPTWGRCEDMDTVCNYKGGLTHEYVEWLENKYVYYSMDIMQIRTAYRKTVKGAARSTYYDKNGYMRYTKGYKEYLEEQVLMKLC